MRRILLASLALMCAIPGAVFAQSAGRTCGFSILQQKDPVKWNALRDQHNTLAAQVAAGSTTPGNAQAKIAAVPTIPVVFHFVLTQTQFNRIGGNAGIAQRVDSQMAVLNRDFNRRNADSSTIPSVFKPYYANVGIPFGIAHTSPTGTSTTGIEVKVLAPGADSFYSLDNYCADAKVNTTKGLTAWDPNKYLNIWVINITFPGFGEVLGVTTPPTFKNQTFDGHFFTPGEIGIVLNYGATGKRRTASDYYIAQTDLGRTLTHEVGHYFELWHIWGDDDGACPGSATYFDDGIADTPPQGGENQGCPAFPHASCSATVAPNGDMFMNYMDYTVDACMKMFTAGQATMMNAQLVAGAPSYSLTQNPQLTQWPTSVSKLDYDASLVIAPNPTKGNLTVSFLSAPKELKAVTVVNTLGQTILNAAVNDANQTSYNFNLSGMSPGLYFVQCTFAEGKISKKIVLQ